MKKTAANPGHISSLLMRWRGWADSQKGSAVVDAAINKMILYYRSYEHDLTAETDKLLAEVRNNAANDLAAIARIHDTKPGQTAILGTDPLSEIRARRKQEAQAAADQEALRTAAGSVVLAHEKIVEENALLKQQIAGYRQRLNAKLQDYLKGVRSGALPDYIPQEPPEDNAAFQLYINEHARLDNAIREAAEHAQIHTYVVKGA